MRVWSRAETYDALLGSPGAWLTRIARHRAIDRLRARRVRGDINSQLALIEAAFFEGYTHRELADQFGMPLGTVKTRIRTGLAAMRGRLKQAI